jgi:hypothetical protein
MRQARERNERAWLAYTTAALHRATKRITLQSLLIKPKRSLDEQLAGLAAWVAATGGKVIRRKD